jgi:flagellar basal body-associated protein FliL
MKKPLLITIIVLAVLLILPAVSFLRWAFQEKKPVNVVILDKTVPTLERLGHRSFVYAMNNDRFVKKAKEAVCRHQKTILGLSR